MHQWASDIFSVMQDELEGHLVSPSLTSSLNNLQLVDIEIHESDERELGLLAFHLQIDPVLKQLYAQRLLITLL